MSSTDTVAEVVHKKAPKPLKPARKQVKPGQVEKKETPQTGKEYSESNCSDIFELLLTDILKTSGIINGQVVIVKIAIQSMSFTLHYTLLL